MYYILSRPIIGKVRYRALGISGKYNGDWRSAETWQSKIISSLGYILLYVRNRKDALHFTEERADTLLLQLKEKNPTMFFKKKLIA